MSGERRGEEVGKEKIFIEIIHGNFPNFMKNIYPQIQESQKLPSTRNMKNKNTSMNIIIKMIKTKIKRKF